MIKLEDWQLAIPGFILLVKGISSLRIPVMTKTVPIVQRNNMLVFALRLRMYLMYFMSVFQCTPVRGEVNLGWVWDTRPQSQEAGSYSNAELLLTRPGPIRQQT